MNRTTVPNRQRFERRCTQRIPLLMAVGRCLALYLVLVGFSGVTGLRAAEPASAAYHELRLYTVTSNKLDAVLERFRDTVEPVRRKHGITTIGFWATPGTTNGGTVAYLMATCLDNRVVLLRQHAMKPPIDLAITGNDVLLTSDLGFEDPANSGMEVKFTTDLP